MAAWLDKGGGVDAEREGETLLMAATVGGQEAMVRMLLPRGASVNLQDTKGRYAVTVEGETEAVLLKPAKLQEFLEPAQS